MEGHHCAVVYFFLKYLKSDIYLDNSISIFYIVYASN